MIEGSKFIRSGLDFFHWPPSRSLVAIIERRNIQTEQGIVSAAPPSCYEWKWPGNIRWYVRVLRKYHRKFRTRFDYFTGWKGQFSYDSLFIIDQHFLTEFSAMCSTERWSSCERFFRFPTIPSGRCPPIGSACPCRRWLRVLAANGETFTCPCTLL